MQADIISSLGMDFTLPLFRSSYRLLSVSRVCASSSKYPATASSTSNGEHVHGFAPAPYGSSRLASRESPLCKTLKYSPKVASSLL